MSVQPARYDAIVAAAMPVAVPVHGSTRHLRRWDGQRLTLLLLRLVHSRGLGLGYSTAACAIAAAGYDKISRRAADEDDRREMG